MAFISDKDREAVRKAFEALKEPVTIAVFTQEFECMYCKETRELSTEVAELSDKLSLQVFDFVKDKAEAEKFGVDKIPATILLGEEDYGLKFYGMPTGYEFSTLLEDIIMVSQRDSGLRADTREFLKGLKDDVHLEVFIGITCPYCPVDVRTAHKFALESPRVRADMVEIAEFPHLAQQHRIMAVPTTVINGKHVTHIKGSETVLAREIEKALEN